MSRIAGLFNVKYPLIQGGMIWNSGWRLASAVSNAGGLGLIGAASMYPDVLLEHVQKCKKATDNPFGVNIPMLYPNIEEHMKTVVDNKVPIVFTSAGNPKLWTNELKRHGIKVVHVVSSVKFALKAQEAGVDAVVAEGFEAGGHNGREETTTFTLIPIVKKKISVPLIAAGGIATGRGMLAAMTLGADGVQLGSRFAASKESSAHLLFKEAIVEAQEGDTLLGRARAKRGMFEGDMEEGELEIGQISGLIDDILPAQIIVKNIISEYNQAKEAIATLPNL